MSDNDSNGLTSDSDQALSNASVPQRHTEFALVPHDAFNYPRFKPDSDTPKFEPHPFWTTMSSKRARPLAKLVCLCLSTEHNYTAEEADEALKNGLRVFCFAVTTLDPTKLVPRDITVAFYGIWYLLSIVPDSDSEWHVFPLPKDKDIPAYHPDSAPPKATLDQKLPTSDQLENAPPLSKTVLISKPTPSASAKISSPKKGKGKARAPKSVSEVVDSSDEEQKPPAKRIKLSEKPNPVISSSPAPAGRVLRPHTEVDYHSQGAPDKKTSPSKPKADSHPICLPPSVSSQKKIDTLIPFIHEALLEMLDERKKTKFRK
ncbi:hypothetical protein B0H14DRAFT_3507816 [Mycena olivaceomarginata]|nr:hypothetical protein B0H14DRAFT_3507816 [Mycena olivaceomarginata]